MSIFIFWAAAAITLYAYVVYPLCIYLLSFLHPRRWLRKEVTSSISIVMAVHNGARLLRERLDHLLALGHAGAVEIIVVSDGSTDRTNGILAEVDDPRVVSIICPEHRGKANALNHGIRRATGDILVFVDIRPSLEKDALKQLLSNFADPTVGCVAGELCLQTNAHDGGTRAVSNLYWRYEQSIRKCEAMVDSPVGVYGGFYAVRRALATAMPEGLILDDMYQPLSVIRQGYRSVIDDCARVWDVWPEKSRAEFQRKVRTLAGNYQLLAKAGWLLGRTNRLRFQLISHKIARLVVPFMLTAVLVTSFEMHAVQPYGVLLAGQIIFYLLAALGLVWDPPLLRRVSGPASAFLMLNTAAGLALFMFLFRPNSLLGLWVKPEPAPQTGPVGTT